MSSLFSVGRFWLYTKSGAWKNSSPEFQFLYTKRHILVHQKIGLMEKISPIKLNTKVKKAWKKTPIEIL